MHHQPPVHRSIDPAAAVVPEVRPRLRWRDVPVDGRTVPYGIAGSGTPVLFLHGFGLAPRTYAAAVERLAAVGVRVYAPALPGFGGTGALPHREHGFAGYGHWVARFLDAVGIDEPVPVVGHSFGGGVALASAHARVDRVSQLVLVNSVGGGAWSPSGTVREIRHRPLWRWGASALADAVLTGTPGSAIASIAGASLRNAVRDPAALWRIGELARSADLRAEAEEVVDRGVPATLVWSSGDTFIPRASFESLRTALREPQVHRVAGCHGWLIGDPDGFGRAMGSVLLSTTSAAA
ncbi:alpha/beta fold hydrolase [Prescottella equi]|uniref:Alpha/beta fold hydrolase n=1 Tax=Rhodococcus hoagii TaxID=43767 RepID=A0AAP2F3U9_RHOHA|nr:alpha/beta fold hydrolase [Prescottella equi]MBU4617432.1 alpha/beta fold hydrolase [Rhodococcus sp. GG48]ERN46517.1 lipase [Prescottella equi NBRC 101255 = C 7]MBM4625821.1 alpha/beta fold hydrolase [Prescottella equi]MBM4728983.1 alpha/beta fold hydrolase [Prescottella equi]NKS01022.1 alpha/beta fold hydrolase [Prescottella equi]